MIIFTFKRSTILGIRNGFRLSFLVEHVYIFKHNRGVRLRSQQGLFLSIIFAFVQIRKAFIHFRKTNLCFANLS